MELKEILRQSYNNSASIREKNELQDWKIRPRESFLELLMNTNKSTLLDIGAGTGRDSKFFMSNKIDVMAVDLSEEMIRLCQEKEINSRRLDFYNLRQIDR